MKWKLSSLIGLMGASFLLISVIGCENGASSPSDVTGPKTGVKIRPEHAQPGIVAKKTPKPVKGSPSVFIPENSYEFPPVVDGISVTHDFIIENRGDRDLEISRVKTS